jgi:hypothetical protein
MRRTWVPAVVLLVATLVVARPSAASAAPTRTFTYSLGVKGAVEGDVFEFAATAAAVLNDPAGWGLGGAVRFEAVPEGGEFRLLLASPEAIDATSRACSDDFSCRVGNQVLVNDARWRLGAAPYTGPIDAYRAYVINHEVGHWLGFGHAQCGGPGEPAPIMAQQSKGLGGCLPTSRPSAGERMALAERLGLTGAPFGSLDVVALGDRTVRVAGWAIDPDDDAPIAVHVYVDDRGTALDADIARPDVAAAFPGSGDRHGFDAAVAMDPGVHRVCAYAIDRGGVSNTTLGCRIVDYASPFGSIDIAQREGASLHVAGWAIDPHTAQPIDVHVYVGTTGVALTADAQRDDIALAFPSAGAHHGFDALVPVDADATSVCIYAIAVGGGANPLLGCRALSR